MVATADSSHVPTTGEKSPIRTFFNFLTYRDFDSKSGFFLGDQLKKIGDFERFWSKGDFSRKFILESLPGGKTLWNSIEIVRNRYS